jgi:serine/threonine protein phosphatase PrpC
LKQGYGYRSEQMRRKDNQDTLGVFELFGHRVLLVCDGMGGHAGGAHASALAVRTVHEELSAAITDPREDLKRAVEVANRTIFEASRKNYKLNGMGTTIVAVIITDGVAHVAHVGDSRVYLVRDGALRALTRDHTMVNVFVDAELLSPQDAATHPEAHVLSRSLGVERDVDVEMSAPVVLTLGDRLLLTSDGVHGPVSEDLLAGTDWSNPQAGVDQVLAAVREAGGDDNATLVAYAMGYEGASSPPTAVPTLDAAKAADEGPASAKPSVVTAVPIYAEHGPPQDVTTIEDLDDLPSDLVPKIATRARSEVDLAAARRVANRRALVSLGGLAVVGALFAVALFRAPAQRKPTGLTTGTPVNADVATSTPPAPVEAEQQPSAAETVAPTTPAAEVPSEALTAAPAANTPPGEAVPAEAEPSPAEPIGSPPPAEAVVAEPAPAVGAQAQARTAEPAEPAEPAVVAAREIEPPSRAIVAAIEAPIPVEPRAAVTPPVAPAPTPAPVASTPVVSAPVPSTPVAAPPAEDAVATTDAAAAVDAPPPDYAPEPYCVDCSLTLALPSSAMYLTHSAEPDLAVAFYSPRVPKPPKRMPHAPLRYEGTPPRGPAQAEAIRQARGHECAGSVATVQNAIRKSVDYAVLYRTAWFCYSDSHQNALASADAATFTEFVALLDHFEGPRERATSGDPSTYRYTWADTAVDGVEHRLSTFLSDVDMHGFRTVMTDLLGPAALADQLGADVFLEASAASALARVENPGPFEVDTWARRVFVSTSAMNSVVGDLIREYRPDLAQTIDGLLLEATGGDAGRLAVAASLTNTYVPREVAKAQAQALGQLLADEVAQLNDDGAPSLPTSGARPNAQASSGSAPSARPRTKPPTVAAREPEEEAQTEGRDWVIRVYKAQGPPTPRSEP